MSLTHIATRSIPTVSCLSIKKAILSFVPTPSVELTRTGFSIPAILSEKSAPNPPISPITPVLGVCFAMSLILLTRAFALSISTPASA